MVKYIFFFILLFGALNVFAETATMAILGDAGLTGPDLNKLHESISQEKIKSLILPGDNLYHGRYTWTWDTWKETGFYFDITAIGNHNDGYAKEVKYFEVPGEYYSIVKNHARFLVLNSDNENKVDEQCHWLEEEIGKVQEKQVFLVYHHPTFDTGGGHSWRVKEKFQLCMREFFKKHKSQITALLLGHEHITSLVDFDGIPAIIAGSGREIKPSKAVFYDEDGFKIRTKFLAPETQYWAALEIPEGGDDAWVDFIQVSDNAHTCRVHLKPGSMELGSNCPKPELPTTH